MAQAAERRAATERRFTDLEARTSQLEKGVARMSKQTDRWQQTLEWVIEGSEKVEEMYMAYIESEGGPGWRKFKEDIGAALIEEIAAHLKLVYPFQTPEPKCKEELGEGATEQQYHHYKQLKEMSECLKESDCVGNINVQRKKGPNDQFERIKGVFVMVLRPGATAWTFKSAVGSGIEKAMRKASGLAVNGEAADVEMAGQQQPKKFLLYHNKTQAQREAGKAAKGKAKGKDKGDGGKGKGKGKKGRAGKGGKGK